MNKTNTHKYAENEDTEDNSGRLSINIGNTTFVLGLHFSQTSKLTLEDKIKRLIRKDIDAGNL